MKDPYIRIQSIFDREVNQNDFVTMPNTVSFSVNSYEFNALVQILGADNITPRQKDGVPRRARLSIPTSIKHAFVLGIRCQKKDDTYTEDAYIIHPCKKINYLKKGEIEKLLPEYKGTHKRQSAY
jgi:hypothetical protein